jgi:hypothetical protein
MQNITMPTYEKEKEDAEAVRELEAAAVVQPKESCALAKRLFRLFGPLGSMTLLMLLDMVLGAYLFIYLESPQEAIDRQVRNNEIYSIAGLWMRSSRVVDEI